MTQVDQNRMFVKPTYNILLPKEYFISQEELYISEPIRILSCNRSGTLFLKSLLMPYMGEIPFTHWNMFCVDSPCEMILSPIRDPYDVYVSLYSNNVWGFDFFRVWELFNQAYEKGIIKHILPVDLPERREQDLAELSNILGEHIHFCDLKTNWKKVNSSTREKAPYVDLCNVYDLPVVRKFYPNGQHF